MVNYCPECGTKNPDEANFCQKCGSKLVIPDESDVNRQLGEFEGISIFIPKTDEIIKKDGRILIYEDKFIFIDNDGISKEIQWNQVKEILYSQSQNKTRIYPINRDIHYRFQGSIKIDGNKAINKMRSSKQHFTVESEVVIEVEPEKIKDDAGKRVGATLLGGFLLGPVGALAGYAATRGPTVIQTSSKQKTIKQSFSFDVSVHKKGIKMINEAGDKSFKQIKIPWDQIVDISYHGSNVKINTLNEGNIAFIGNPVALKGLYLITKKELTEEEGWE